MKILKYTLISIGIAIVSFIVFSIIYEVIISISIQSGAFHDGEMAVRTRNKITKIALDIHSLIHIWKDYSHPVSPEQIIMHEYKLRLEYDDPFTIEQLEEELGVDFESKQYLDYWQMPIIIEFTEPATYKFISFGPNKQDDKGGGDDLIEQFDLTIWPYRKYVVNYEIEGNVYEIDDNKKIDQMMELLWSIKKIDPNQLGDIIPNMFMDYCYDNYDTDKKYFVRINLYANLDGSLPVSDEAESYLESFREVFQNAEQVNMEEEFFNREPDQEWSLLLVPNDDPCYKPE